MIVKHIPMRSAKRSSFAGLAAYITAAHGKEERVGKVRTTNLASEAVEDAVREVAATQGMNTRAVGDKTYHLVVSFAPGETPDGNVLQAVEEAVCASIGFGEHERVSAVHHDTDAVHVHIAINKVHPRTFRLHEPYRAYRTLGAVAAELEQRFGLEATNHTPRKTQGENRADNMAEAAGMEPLRDWVRRTCLADMQAAESWRELHEVAARHGLSLTTRGAGLVITDGEGRAIKPSTVARDLSRGALEARLGPFEPVAGAVTPPARRYAPTPIVGTAEATQLFARYQREKSVGLEVRTATLAQARARRDAAVQAALRRNRLERAAIKLAGHGHRRLLYTLASRRLAASLKDARERFGEERATLHTATKPAAWADWLQMQAAAGDAAALAALRARRKRRGAGAGVVVPGEQTWQPTAGDAALDTVTKRGTLIYSSAAAAVRDDGARLSVSRGAGDEAIAVALRVARARFGGTLDIQGSAAFRDQVAAVAARLLPGVRFHDPEMEQRRQALASVAQEKADERADGPSRGDRRAGGLRDAGRAVVRRPGQLAPHSQQPDAGELGGRPPAHRRDRLRTLSALGMVRVAGGGEMLLPRDVSHHVEQSRAAGADRLRRPDDRPGLGQGDSKPAQAADAYVAEREARRQMIADIPQHLRYSGVNETLAFAGIRTVHGQRLALLQRGEVVMVKPIDDEELSALPKRMGRAVRIENGRIAPTPTRKRTR